MMESNKYQVEEIKNIQFKTKGRQKGEVERKQKWENVDKKTFFDFINNYPNKLEGDYYMDAYSYNDFTLGKWPDSMVAIAHETWDSENPYIYSIWRGDYEEIVYEEEILPQLIIEWNDIKPVSIECSSD